MRDTHRRVKEKGWFIMDGEMSYKQGIYLKLIDRFADSGHKLCEITFTKEDKENRSDEVIMNGITRAAKRYNK